VTGRAPIAATARRAAAAAWAALALSLVPAGLAALPLWADGNGDGLPDPAGGVTLTERTALVTVDVWIDSQSFVWTNFQVWLEHPTALAYEDGAYLVSGGNPFPVDDFTRPTLIGLGGFGHLGGRHGVTLLARLTFHKTCAERESVSFLIDPSDSNNIVSTLATPTGYFLFDDAVGTSWATPGHSVTDETPWRRVKGLYE
jgi:hypothetical protein